MNVLFQLLHKLKLSLFYFPSFLRFSHSPFPPPPPMCVVPLSPLPPDVRVGSRKMALLIDETLGILEKSFWYPYCFNFLITFYFSQKPFFLEVSWDDIVHHPLIPIPGDLTPMIHPLLALYYDSFVFSQQYTISVTTRCLDWISMAYIAAVPWSTATWTLPGQQDTCLDPPLELQFRHWPRHFLDCSCSRFPAWINIK